LAFLDRGHYTTALKSVWIHEIIIFHETDVFFDSKNEDEIKEARVAYSWSGYADALCIVL